jgi:WD40 repeat protein
MKKLTNKVVILALITIFLLNGCATPPLESPPGSTATLTFTSVPTSTPTLTPTPIPVSIKDAIAQGTFSEIKTLGKGRIQQSIFSPDGSQFIAVISRGIYVYDTKNWQETKYIPIPVKATVSVIDLSYDGKIFAVGDIAGNTTFWNTETWDILQNINAYKGLITSLKISPDGLSFVTVGDNKTISVWDLHNGTLIKSLEQEKKVGNANYSSDGKWVLTTGDTSGGDLLIRSASNLEIANRYGGFRDFPSNYAISPFANLAIFIESLSGKMNVRDLDDKKILGKIPTEFASFERITHWIFLDKSQLIVKGEHSDFFYLVNLKTYDLKKISTSEFFSIAGNNPQAWSITKEKEIQSLGFELKHWYVPEFITPDGSALVLRSWDPVSIGAMKLEQKDSRAKFMQIDFGYLTMKNENLVVIKWNSKEKQGNFTISEVNVNEMRILSETQFKYDVDNAIQRVALSNDGTLLAAGTESGTLYVWNTNKKAQIASFHAYEPKPDSFGGAYAFNKIAFSSDDTLIAAENAFRMTIKVWSIQDGKEIISVSGTKQLEYEEWSLSPDSKYLAYATNDTVHVKSLHEAFNEIILTGHSPDGRIDVLRFSSDGSMLFSGGSDKTVKIWSVTDKTLLMDLPQFGEVTSVILSPDKTLLYIATNDGIISVLGHASPK